MKKHVVEIGESRCSVRLTETGLYLRITQSALRRRRYYWHKTKADALAAQQKWAKRQIKDQSR